MSTGTAIEWSDATWNPVVGCTRVSAGCDNCYATKMTHRLASMGQAKYAGLTVLNGRGERHFNGVVRTDEAALTVPLSWRKPRRVFVNSMSDLFHRDVPFEFVDRVFAVMALTPRHTYQILTKRPERMAEYLHDRRPGGDSGSWEAGRTVRYGGTQEIRRAVAAFDREAAGDVIPREFDAAWPLRNVWLGTSVEDQDAADKRIPHLLRCPAAVRFLSVEPLLGPVDLYKPGLLVNGTLGMHGADWVIVGCESKPGKALGRFADGYADAALNIIDQCAAAGVPVFHKQMPVNGRACGDMAQFPERFRVREFPRRES
jgi:protein gp37